MVRAEILQRAIALTAHRRFAELLDPSHPDYDSAYEPVVWAIVEEQPVPISGQPAVDSPPLLSKAVNFAGAVVQHVSAGFPKADQEAASRRLAICRTCPMLRGDSCAVCGCQMSSKVTWAEQKCPEGRW